MGYKQLQFSPGKDLAEKLEIAYKESGAKSKSEFYSNLIRMGLNRYLVDKAKGKTGVESVDELLQDMPTVSEKASEYGVHQLSEGLESAIRKIVQEELKPNDKENAG